MGSQLSDPMDKLGMVSSLVLLYYTEYVTDEIQVVARLSITGRLHVRRRCRLDFSRAVLVDDHQAFTPSAVLEVLEGYFLYFFCISYHDRLAEGRKACHSI